MKKLAIVLLAMVFALGMAFTAQAANQVNVKTNSEPITKQGCEKNGSIQFTFDAGSVISSGYWWIIDLPLGATLCQNIDFVITAGAAGALFDAAAVGVIPNGATVQFGPVKIKDIGADLLASGLITEGATGVMFRVQGASGSQRVTVTAGDPAGGDWDLPLGTGAIRIWPETEFTITLFDQSLYVASFMWEDSNSGAAGTPRDNIYGNDATGLGLDDLEIVDNTLCVNAQNMAGNYVNVSLDSRDDVWNFTGDNEVAHVMAANVISLTACKGDTTGNVQIAGQGACTFDYETPLGYCPAPATFAGNRIIITNNNNWDDADYALTYTIISPAAGVYWTALPGMPEAFTSAQDGCGVGVALAACPGVPWANYKADGITTAAGANTSCSIPANEQGRVLSLPQFGKTCGDTLNVYNKLMVNMPAFAYDSSVVTNGTQVIVQVDLIKVPCGVIFTGTRTVATIVTSCATVAPVITPITLQYFTNPSSQWWAGFAIANESATAGTVDLAVYEEDGDVGTVNDVAIGARGTDGCLGVWLTSDLFTLLTPAAGNAGQLGDARFFMIVTPDVPGMEAFVMMGDGSQAMGYVKP